MYRLHIDIPLENDEEEAIRKAESFVSLLMMVKESIPSKQFNYRLGHDEDRQKSNYLDKNENGHVSNKKTKISL
tara:strand:+ start:3128 stop:3349 length:222 start_codon:yes stop_codon:yes gene_type:complete